jgi:phage major head subunit gpT-like protein
MGAQGLSSRAIIGEFYRTLNQDDGAAWVSAITMLFTSDQDSETYKWLGQSYAMREWVGGRHARGFRENGITIANKHYESTIDVLVKDMRRDKTGQVMVRIQDLAKRTNSHWASLISTLLLNAAATVCYDGQYFFDTDHSEGDSGTQSNKINVDISALPVAVHGSAVTAPSVEEMQLAIAAAIQQIAGFKDDAGEPMNEDATQFVVMVPISLMNTALQAVATPTQIDASQTVLQALKGQVNISVAANARLTWTDTFAVIRTDGSVSPFIRQQETAVMLKAKADGSEYEFDNDAHQYGVDAWRNVGYGYWQHACLVTLT